jgi:hypothetical protein
MEVAMAKMIRRKLKATKRKSKMKKITKGVRPKPYPVILIGLEATGELIYDGYFGALKNNITRIRRTLRRNNGTKWFGFRSWSGREFEEVEKIMSRVAKSFFAGDKKAAVDSYETYYRSKVNNRWLDDEIAEIALITDDLQRETACEKLHSRPQYHLDEWESSLLKS